MHAAPVDEDDDDYVPGPGDNAAEEQEEEEAGDLQKDAEINAAGPSGGRLTSGRRRQSRAGATKRQRTQAVAHQANGASNEPLTPLLISQADINRLSAKVSFLDVISSYWCKWRYSKPS